MTASLVFLPVFRGARRWWLAMAISLAVLAGWPARALADVAASAYFVRGQVTAQVPGQAVRALQKGADVFARDQVETGQDGRTQLRFTDGGLVSLMPNSQFSVEEYRQADPGADNGSAVFGLLRGGLRTVTGSIGKQNHDQYQLKTPVATLGIRGTEYVAILSAPDTLHVHVTAGRIVLTNDHGTLEVPMGFSAIVRLDGPPTLSDTPPDFFARAPQGEGGAALAAQQEGAAGEVRQDPYGMQVTLDLPVLDAAVLFAQASPPPAPAPEPVPPAPEPEPEPVPPAPEPQPEPAPPEPSPPTPVPTPPAPPVPTPPAPTPPAPPIPVPPEPEPEPVPNPNPNPNPNPTPVPTAMTLGGIYADTGAGSSVNVGPFILKGQGIADADGLQAFAEQGSGPTAFSGATVVPGSVVQLGSLSWGQLADWNEIGTPGFQPFSMSVPADRPLTYITGTPVVTLPAQGALLSYSLPPSTTYPVVPLSHPGDEAGRLEQFDLTLLLPGTGTYPDLRYTLDAAVGFPTGSGYTFRMDSTDYLEGSWDPVEASFLVSQTAPDSSSCRHGGPDCTLEVAGFLSGFSGGEAGISYVIRDGSPLGEYRYGGVAPLQATQPAADRVAFYMVDQAATTAPLNLHGTAVTTLSGSATKVSDRLADFSHTTLSPQYLTVQGGTPVPGVGNASSDGVLYWGELDNIAALRARFDGFSTHNWSNWEPSSAGARFAYVAGQAATAQPSGTMSYIAEGVQPSPIRYLGSGGGGPWTLDSVTTHLERLNLTLYFGQNPIQYNLDMKVTVNSDQYEFTHLTTPGELDTATAFPSFRIEEVPGTACPGGGACFVDLNGFVAGHGAQGIGLVYDISDDRGSSEYRVLGSAMLKQDGGAPALGQ